MDEPITAAELWDEMSETARTELSEHYMLIDGEVWKIEDVPRCDECQMRTFELLRDEYERELCEHCDYEGRVIDADSWSPPL